MIREFGLCDWLEATCAGVLGGAYAGRRGLDGGWRMIIYPSAVEVCSAPRLMARRGNVAGL